MKRLLGLALAFFLCASAVFALDIEMPRGTVTLPEKAWGGETWVCARTLAGSLHGTYGRDEISGYPLMVLNGKRILFSTATAVASVEGRIVRFGRIPVEKEGCLYLPLSGLSKLLELVYGGSVAIRRAKAPPAPAAASPGRLPKGSGSQVTGAVSVSSDLVRLTLKGSAVRTAKVTPGPRNVQVALTGGYFALAQRDLGEGIVTSYRVERRGSLLLISLGPGFSKLDVLKLRNPDRLVLLLKGRGQRVPGAAFTVPGQPREPAPSPQAAPSLQPAPVKTQAFDVVVVDPGHGGSDTGAIGISGIQEKTVTLAIAELLKTDLEEAGIKVILTRTGDETVPLMQRTALANFNKADLFVSIHANSSPAKSARGAETYYMSVKATDLWSKNLAEKENSAVGKSPGDRDPLSLVLWKLAQTAHITESSVLAETIQEEFNALLNTANRGVRQAPFVVLEGAEMPAVLIEVAFLSNRADAAKLADPGFQAKAARAIAKSIFFFKTRYENPHALPGNQAP